jgi:hypothetical protein
MGEVFVMYISACSHGHTRLLLNDADDVAMETASDVDRFILTWSPVNRCLDCVVERLDELLTKVSPVVAIQA